MIIHGEPKIWQENGVPHRLDGPAVEWTNGGVEWYVHGLRHREDGPAIEHKGGYKVWFIRNHRHREDGPAVIHPDSTVEWWLNGKKYYSINEWARALGIFDTNEFVLMKLEYGI